MACDAPGAARADDDSHSRNHEGIVRAAEVAKARISRETRTPGESCLGVDDRGIWSDLDDRVQLALPAGIGPEQVRAHRDAERGLLVVYVHDHPYKAYPLGGEARLEVGDAALLLRPGDAEELRPLLSADNLRDGAARGRDRDDDGLPDALDILIGAKKTVVNAASYGAGYIRIDFPMGDVPRDVGVCTDVIVRAVRNAGLDIQRELKRDIRRARRAYPMVHGRGNHHIDHRRVKTLLPYFRRHWDERAAEIADPDDPLRPGDIVFMDTFPNKAGPDHIGIISDRVNEDGVPLVINNWTDGTVTAEMDLLGWVPVTHRFRAAR